MAERAAARAGFGGDPRLYTRRARRRRDFATSVLLDGSLSTDAWIRGRRVLDVAREAVLVLGEVAAHASTLSRPAAIRGSAPRSGTRAPRGGRRVISRRAHASSE